MTTYKIKEMNSEDRKKFIHCVKTNLDYDRLKNLCCSPIVVYRFPEFKMDSVDTYHFTIRSRKPFSEFCSDERYVGPPIYSLDCWSGGFYNSGDDLVSDDIFKKKYDKLDDLLNYFIDTTFIYSTKLNIMCDTKKDYTVQLMSPTNNECCICKDEIPTRLRMNCSCRGGLCIHCFIKMKGNKCPICKTVLDEPDNEDTSDEDE